MINHSFDSNYITWNNKNILIIDDDYVNFIYIKDLFADTKANIIRGKSKNEVIKQIKAVKNIDLILINVYFVENKNCSLITEIKNINKYIPIAAIVDKNDIDNIAECIRAGCETYFHKPFDKFHFLATLNDILEKGRIIKSLYKV